MIFSPQSLQDGIPALGIEPCATDVSCSAAPQQEVGHKRLSDSELSRHIASCGYLMEQAYARYEESNDIQDIGEAHRWRVLMEEAIKSRRPCFVSKLEAKRGLA